MQTAATGLLSLFFLLISWSPLSAQELHTYVDRDSLEAGEVFTYTLLLNTTEPYRSIRFPGVQDFSGEEIELVEREHHEISALRDSVVYRLQFFGIEDYRIPALPVAISAQDGSIDTLRTTPVPLLFKSVLSEGEEEYRPLKPIFDFSASFWSWFLILLLLAAAAWFFYRRYFGVRDQKPEPAEPEPQPTPFTDPLVVLKKRLETLSGSDSPLKRREFKTFYIELGDAIRLYFEQVYTIDALEMTSGEILRELRDWPAEKPMIESTRKVLQEADMVKFARFEPDITQAENTMGTAFEFYEVAARTDSRRIERMREQHEGRHSGTGGDAASAISGESE